MREYGYKMNKHSRARQSVLFIGSADDIGSEEFVQSPHSLLHQTAAEIVRTLLALKGSVDDFVTVLRFATISGPNR
jgi:hypothetical protein